MNLPLLFSILKIDETTHGEWVVPQIRGELTVLTDEKMLHVRKYFFLSMTVLVFIVGTDIKYLISTGLIPFLHREFLPRNGVGKTCL